MTRGGRGGRGGRSEHDVNILPPGVIAVVKADAYGHGAVEVSRVLEREGVSMLAVAYLGEALELRQAGVKCPVLVMFDSSAVDVERFFEYNFTPVIYDVKKAAAFANEARRRNRSLDVHIKVDTGMGRLGLGAGGGNGGTGGSGAALDAAGPGTTVGDAVKVTQMKNLNVKGLMSHFSEAELTDVSYAELQVRRFDEVKRAVMKCTAGPILCHMANSAAVISYAASHMDAVRPGLMLYGINPMGDGTGAGRRGAQPFPALKPAMRVKTRVLALRRLNKGTPVSYGRIFVTGRKTRAAIIAAGYADGYLRAFSNTAHVVIRGMRAPVIGRVCMDLTVVDVTGVPGVCEGDEVVLLGRGSAEVGQGGRERRGRPERVDAWELAKLASTIPYEVLTSLGGRAQRGYTSR